MQRQKSANITVRLSEAELQRLLDAIAERAYEEGYTDASLGKKKDASRVRVPPHHTRKLRWHPPA
jgi:hypothetical protein